MNDLGRLARLFAPANHRHPAPPPQVAAGAAQIPLIPPNDVVTVRVTLNRSMRSMEYDVVPTLLGAGNKLTNVEITSITIIDSRHVDVLLTNSGGAVPAGNSVQVIAVAGSD